MIYAFDTYYFERYANTVCIAFEDWSSDKETAVYTAKTAVVTDYESDAFFTKESCLVFSIYWKVLNLKKEILLLLTDM